LEALSNLSTALQDGDLSDISPEVLAQTFGAAASMRTASGVVADVLEDPRVGFQVSAEASVKAHKFFNAKLEKEGDTVKGGLENKFLGFTIDGTPSDRKIGATFTVGTGNLYGAYEYKRQFSVEFTYRNNEEYVQAMGLDAGNLPGARTVLSMMNRMSGVVQPEDKSPPPAGAMEAALNEIKALLPPIFEAGAKFETMTMGSAASVTRDGVELGITKKERFRPNDAGGSTQQFTETKLGYKIEKEFKGDVLKAGVSAGVTFSTDPELTTSPDKLALAADIRKHGLVHAVGESLKKSIIVEKADEIASAHAAITSMPRTDLTDTDRILAVDDPKVGGVMLHFSPELLATGVPPADVAGMLASFANVQAKHASNFVVAVPSTSKEYHAVPLSSLVNAGPGATVGKLTRITGCVVDHETGDVRIIGLVEAGREAVSLDVLVVGLRAIWKEGGTPFISLDAIPGAEFGPQNSRVGGLSKELKESQFVLDMLDADYAMKQINLGRLDVSVPGFRSSKQIQEASDDMTEGMTRYWLYPRQSAAADVWFHRDGQREALCFDSQVCVLTERMHQISSFSAGIPEPDRLAEEAARQFTRHYPAIADQHPVFQRLYAVFDVAKLAAVLRHRGVKSAQLDTFCARPIRKVAIPKSYEGIGPIMIRDGTFFIGGGARTKVRLAPGSVVPSNELAAFFAATASRPVETSLPSASVLLPGAVRGVAAEVLAGQGLAMYGQLKYREAKELLDEAIAADPSIEEALMYRALAHRALGDVPGALKDAEAYAAVNPEMQGFLGLMRMYVGQRAEALADVRACRKRFPDSESVLLTSALVHMFALELDDAEAEADELIGMSPQSNEGYEIRAMVDTFRRIGPERSKARVSQTLKTPIPIAEALSSGTARLQTFDFDGAVQELEGALALSSMANSDASLSTLYLRERAEMVLAFALNLRAGFYRRLGYDLPAKEDADRAIELCEQLRSRHPTWPSAQLMLAVVSLSDENPESGRRAMEAFASAKALPTAGDALMEEFATQLGADNAMAMFGLTLFNQVKTARSEEKVALLKDVVALLGEGLAARIWELPAKYHDKPNMFKVKVRALEKEIPESSSSIDPMTLYSIAYFYTMLVGIESEKQEDEVLPESVDYQVQLISKFLRLSDRSDMPPQMLTQIATFRFAMLGLLGEAYHKKLTYDTRMRDALSQVAKGTMEIDPALVISKQVKQELLESAARDLPPLAVEMIRMGFESPRSDAVLYYIAKVDPPSQANHANGITGLSSRLDTLVASATSTMEVRTMLAFVDMLSKSVLMVPSESGREQERAEATRALSTLRAKLMMKSRLSPPKRKSDSRAWLAVSVGTSSIVNLGNGDTAASQGGHLNSINHVMGLGAQSPSSPAATTEISFLVIAMGGAIFVLLVIVVILLVLWPRRGKDYGSAER